MNRSWLRRIAALEAIYGCDAPVDPLLTPCSIRPDACSKPANPCSFDDVSPDNRARVVDLQGWRHARLRLPAGGPGPI
jgi:hypothetical protein